MIKINHDSKKWAKLPVVMRTAIRIFVKKGIDGTSVAEIAERANVAEGALYRHFKGKDELAWYIFSTYFDQFTIDLMSSVLKESHPKDRLRVFVEECFKAFEMDRELFAFLILTEHRELKKFQESRMHPGTLMAKIVEEGQRDGAVREGEPYLLAALVTGGIIRACTARSYGRLSKDLRPLSLEVVKALWAMMENPEKRV